MKILKTQLTNELKKQLTIKDRALEKAFHSGQVSRWGYEEWQNIELFLEPPGDYAYVPPAVIWMPNLKPYLEFKVPENHKKLYDYQAEIILKSDEITSWAKMFVLPTGSGKSIIISHLILRKRVRTLLLLPTIELLKQQKEVLEEFWIKVSMYWNGKKEIWDITVMTNASFWKMRKKDIENFDFDMLIIDEVQKAMGEKTRNAILRLETGLTYSFSATPYTASMTKADFNKFFWESVEYTALNMIPKIYSATYKNKYQLDMERFVQERSQKLDTDKNRIIAQAQLIEKLMLSRKNIMILHDRTNHTHSLHNYFSNKWYKDNYVLTGKMKDDERKSNLQGFKKNWWLLFASDAIAGTWLDAPRIDTVCIFFPNKFDWRVLQMVWRWLRKHKGKKDAIIIDWVDTTLMYQHQNRKRTYRKTYSIWEVKDVSELLDTMEVEI